MQPCPLPPQYEQHDAVGAMRALLALGALTHWTVGTKQGKICSRFVTGSGTEDILTAISETDRDYGQLVAAHVMRVHVVDFTTSIVAAQRFELYVQSNPKLVELLNGVKEEMQRQQGQPFTV